MKLENSFTIDAPIEKAWKALNTPETIATCFPGATLTEYEGDTFSGMVKVKLGPISLTYRGKGVYKERDDAQHRIVIDAGGRDSRGNGTADATVTGTLTADGSDKTAVTMVTDMKITGRPAQFGRSVIADVVDKIIGQFASCVASRLQEQEPAAAGESAKSPGKSPGQSTAGSTGEPTPATGAGAADTEESAAASAGAAGGGRKVVEESAATPAGAAGSGTEVVQESAAASARGAGGGREVVKESAAASAGTAGTGTEVAKAVRAATAAKEDAQRPGTGDAKESAPARAAAGDSATRSETVPLAPGVGTAAGAAGAAGAGTAAPAAVPSTNGAAATPAAAGPALSSTPASPSTPAVATTTPQPAPAAPLKSDIDAIDLLDTAGAPLLKRLAPPVAGGVLLVGIILLIRWLRRR